MGEILLIAGARDPVIADCAAFMGRPGGRRVSVLSTADVCARIKGGAEQHLADDFSKAEHLSAHSADRMAGVVLFLGRKLTETDRALIDKAAEIAAEKRAGCVCLVSSFRAHLGDRRTAHAEDFALGRFRGSPARIVVFRPGHVLGPHSRLSGRLRRLRFLAPVVPGRFRSCCVESEELFAAVEREMSRGGAGRPRTFTLLGPNRPWRDLLQEERAARPPRAFAALAAALLRLCLVGHLAGLLFDLLAQCFPRLRAWSFDTLRPTSVKELLALYNPCNFRHVKIVGYNNGVVHFGQSHPDKTVVSTVRCNRAARLRGDVATFDAGVTVRKAMELLGAEGKELHVLPNYSYVSLGTAFFIPIHGSASKYCTLAETIEKVLLYEPVEDRFIAADRGDPAFGQYLYNLAADVLLLRLSLRVKEKSRYFVNLRELDDPPAEDVLRFFHDRSASNVEVRKAGAASRTVKVYQYYTEPPAGEASARELPRDTLGSLWDRLEANPLTRALFHGLVRRFAHHVELFLPEEELATFWETHRALPLSKIQLRYIRRDGYPNSPFRDHDCVSADLFMLKKHRRAFEAYVKGAFRRVQTNPGKHSM